MTEKHLATFWILNKSKFAQVVQQRHQYWQSSLWFQKAKYVSRNTSWNLIKAQDQLPTLILSKMDLDEFQDKIGGISRYQVLTILAAGLLTFGEAFTSQSASILSVEPSHRWVKSNFCLLLLTICKLNIRFCCRCSVPPVDDPNCYNLTETEIKNLTIPTISGTKVFVFNLAGNYEPILIPLLLYRTTNHVCVMIKTWLYAIAMEIQLVLTRTLRSQFLATTDIGLTQRSLMKLLWHRCENAKV